MHICVAAEGEASLAALRLFVDKLRPLRGTGGSGYRSYSPGLSGLPRSHSTQTVHVRQDLAALRTF